MKEKKNIIKKTSLKNKQQITKPLLNGILLDITYSRITVMQKMAL
jgi:hypothetical protein